MRRQVRRTFGRPHCVHWRMSVRMDGTRVTSKHRTVWTHQSLLNVFVDRDTVTLNNQGKVIPQKLQDHLQPYISPHTLAILSSPHPSVVLFSFFNLSKIVIGG